MFDLPIMSVPYARKLTGLTYAGAKAYVQKLIELKVLDGVRPFHFGGVKYNLPRELITAVEGPLPE
jgi:hypothetical protein